MIHKNITYQSGSPYTLVSGGGGGGDEVSNIEHVRHLIQFNLIGICLLYFPGGKLLEKRN